jgi:hypothetical protein
MPKIPLSAAMLKLGIGSEAWYAISLEWAKGRCAFCHGSVPPAEQCPRDHDAERALAEMGWAHTTLVNPNKRVGLSRRPEKSKVEIHIYSCPKCGKRIGCGFV